MTQRVDSKFFERLSVNDHPSSTSNTQYEAYRTLYPRSTMVLFSKKTKTPLAALIFSADDRGVLSVLTARPSPGDATEPYFQGMLNQPDQDFFFSIVNLTDLGTINFNILHTPHRVSEVDPGPTFGINAVNELHRNQGYTIPCDQRTKRRMRLSGKTKTDTKTGQVSKVTVAQAETKADQKEGLYFYLSVVGSASAPLLVKKFEEGTVWKCVNHFIRQVEKPMWRSKGAGDWRLQSFNSRGGGFRGGSVHLQSRGGGFRGGSQSRSSAAAFTMNETSPAPNYRSLGLEEAGSLGLEEAEEESEEGDMDLLDGDMVSRSMVPESAMVLEDEEVVEFDAVRDGRSTNSAPSSGFDAVDVGSSQAGELKYGEEVVERVGYTGLEYAYEHCSVPTVLCLSLYPDLKFNTLPPKEELKASIEAEIKDWVENEGKRILEALTHIYKEDKCVIDLESPADTVIIQCGHQCINYKNRGDLRKCPMCREHIASFVKADGVLVA